MNVWLMVINGDECLINVWLMDDECLINGWLMDD